MINEGKQGVPDTVKSTLTAIWWLFFSCMLYPGAYLMPLMIDGEMGVVARHMTYGAAGILLEDHLRRAAGLCRPKNESGRGTRVRRR